MAQDRMTCGNSGTSLSVMPRFFPLHIAEAYHRAEAARIGNFDWEGNVQIDTFPV